MSMSTCSKAIAKMGEIAVANLSIVDQEQIRHHSIEQSFVHWEVSGDLSSWFGALEGTWKPLK